MNATVARSRLASVAISCDAHRMIQECNIATSGRQFFYYVEVTDHPDTIENFDRALRMSLWVRDNLVRENVHRFQEKNVTRWFFTTYEDAFAFQMIVP